MSGPTNLSLRYSLTRIFIRIPFHYTVREVEALLSPHAVQSARILYEPDGSSRGIALARLCDPGAARECIQRLHGLTWPSGQKLVVRFADSGAQRDLKRSFLGFYHENGLFTPHSRPQGFLLLQPSSAPPSVSTFFPDEAHRNVQLSAGSAQFVPWSQPNSPGLSHGPTTTSMFSQPATPPTTFGLGIDHFGVFRSGAPSPALGLTLDGNLLSPEMTHQRDVSDNSPVSRMSSTMEVANHTNFTTATTPATSYGSHLAATCRPAEICGFYPWAVPESGDSHPPNVPQLAVSQPSSESDADVKVGVPMASPTIVKPAAEVGLSPPRRDVTRRRFRDKGKGAVKQEGPIARPAGQVNLRSRGTNLNKQV